MKLKIRLAIFATFALAFIVVVFAPGAERAAESAEYTLNFTQTIAVTPDRAEVRAALVSRGSDAAAIRAELDQRATALSEALEALGIEPRHIDIGSLQSHALHRMDRGDQARFEARRGVRVTVTELSGLGEIIAALNNAGVEVVSGISYSDSTGGEAVLLAARNEAIARARALAGDGRARLVSIDLGEHGASAPRTMALAAQAESATPHYAPGEQSRSAQVRAVFEITRADQP
ncbi:uncharacterized protein YggE [Natronocella acetinitrilica]|uniref:Uncharacterized protein YggE n=1 Tax=Natronocella acetinitrilica TaxID=414046 RepID=A0AAE3KB14_9GAMM|nr:SIMPL domain-containing protein [Natronocella acetinitrilica]MCP1674106.1 uncharacterized protein YggE [Natronocella acetinitrilica]